MQTFLSAETLSDEERSAEAAEILTTGVIRLRNSRQDSIFPLDFSPSGSVHDDRYQDGEKQP
ncbi:MAG: hypothetical protein PVI97_15360 [Candidatus Thiodiazotropha sp.]|jgi:hypothetical protein